MKKVHFFSAVLVMLIFTGCKQGRTYDEAASDTTAVEATDSEMLLPNPDDALTVNENTESYAELIENPFESPKTAPLSTFSIDVDNAAYTNIRRFLNNGQPVPKDAVRERATKALHTIFIE